MSFKPVGTGWWWTIWKLSSPSPRLVLLKKLQPQRECSWNPTPSFPVIPGTASCWQHSDFCGGIKWLLVNKLGHHGHFLAPAPTLSVAQEVLCRTSYWVSRSGDRRCYLGRAPSLACFWSLCFILHQHPSPESFLNLFMNLWPINLSRKPLFVPANAVTSWQQIAAVSCLLCRELPFQVSAPQLCITDSGELLSHIQLLYQLCDFM